jgi:transcriptional regulator with XRE-family HTH domain
MSFMSQILDELQRRIQASGKSRYALSKETGIEESALSRFMAGARGLSIESIEKLTKALGCELVLQNKKRKGRKV